MKHCTKAIKTSCKSLFLNQGSYNITKPIDRAVIITRRAGVVFGIDSLVRSCEQD